MLNTDRMLVVSPVTGVSSYILLLNHLVDSAIVSNNVMRGSLSPEIFKPVYGRLSFTLYVANNEPPNP